MCVYERRIVRHWLLNKGKKIKEARGKSKRLKRRREKGMRYQKWKQILYPVISLCKLL